MILDLIDAVDTWTRTLNAFEIAMFVEVFWVSATLGSVVLQYGGVTRRGLGAATLMYGSFTITALCMALIVYAGLSA